VFVVFNDVFVGKYYSHCEEKKSQNIYLRLPRKKREEYNTKEAAL
jgi:hypothetical protein